MDRRLTRVPWPWRAEDPADRRTWALLAAICLAAVALRLLVVFVLHPTCDTDPPDPGCFRPGADAFYYSEQGRLLADGHLWVSANESLSDVPDDELGPGAQHPPLYPAVLAVPSLLGLDGQDAHRAFSAVLGGLGVLVVAAVAWRVAGRRAALIAGGLAAVAPQLWLNDEVGMSEGVFAVLVASVLLAAFGFWERPTTRRAALLGLFIALATLTRTEGIGLVVLLVVPLVVVLPLTNRRRLELAGTSALVVLLLVAPWVAFNVSRFDELTLLTSGTGVTILAGSCKTATEGELMGSSDGECLRRLFAEQELLRREGDAPAEDESVIDGRAREEGLDNLQEDLGRVPAVLVVRAARTWSFVNPEVDRNRDSFVEQRYARGVDGAYWLHLALVPTAVMGLLVLRRRRITVIPFVATFLTATLLAMIAFGLTRFRISADVSMVILAAVAVDAALRSLSARREAAATGPPSEVPVQT